MAWIGSDAVNAVPPAETRLSPGQPVCVLSEFARTQDSARRVLSERVDVAVIIDAGLNELDYGLFEGAPFWEYGR